MFRKSAILSFILLLSFAMPAFAAGPKGHYLIGKQLISNIQNGTCQVDPELRDILQDADAQRAFEGGCVGPDIAEEQSHYNNTATLAANMLKDARANYKAATSPKDQAEARKELAFAYGWYSHCATDLNVHPKVNARVGDTYRFNSPVQKGVHGTQEGHLTAYLRSVIPGGKYDYDVYVPFEFLSKHVGVSVNELKKSHVWLKQKFILEVMASEKVKMTEKIKQNWKAAVTGSLRDSEMFLQNPSAMKNWDLDCGRISTDHFNQLRKLAKEANGGTLPADWGSSYMSWYAKTRGLTASQQLAMLKSLISNKVETSATGNQNKQPSASNSKPTYAWVLTLTKEFPFTDSNYTNSGSNGKYTLKWDSHGCSTQGCPGENLTIQYVCSKPPRVIKPDEKIALTISGNVATNTIQHYSCNTSLDVFFDRAEIDPGFYGGGPGLGGIKLGGRDKTGPGEITIKGSPGHAYEGIGKMALIVAMGNGRNSGTKYIYEWKLTP